MKFLGDYFEKRRKYIGGAQSKNAQLREAMRFFLENKFGKNVIRNKPIADVAIVKDNILTITAENKVIANELSFYLADIHKFLKKENIKVSKILIR